MPRFVLLFLSFPSLHFPPFDPPSGSFVPISCLPIARLFERPRRLAAFPPRDADNPARAHLGLPRRVPSASRLSLDETRTRSLGIATTNASIRGSTAVTSGYLRGSLPGPLDHPHLATTGRAMASADRRSHSDRRHSRPARAQRPRHRDARRFHAEKSGKAKPGSGQGDVRLPRTGP